MIVGTKPGQKRKRRSRAASCVASDGATSRPPSLIAARGAEAKMVRSIDTSQTSPPRLKLDEAALLAYMRRVRARAPPDPSSFPDARTFPSRCRRSSDKTARWRASPRRVSRCPPTCTSRVPLIPQIFPDAPPLPAPPRRVPRTSLPDVTSVAVTQFGHGAEQSDVQGGLPRGRRRPPPRRRSSSARNPRSYPRLRTRRRARVRCPERPRRRRRAPRPSHGLPLRGRLRAGHPLLPHVPRRGSRLRPARPENLPPPPTAPRSTPRWPPPSARYTASIPPRSVSPDSAARMSTRRQLERWARQYRDSVSVPEPPVVALIDWLRANVPPSEPSGALVHGDFRLDNLVFGSPLGPRGAPDDSGGGVVAVLDWELSTLGAPYSDVAYNCMPVPPPAAGSRRTRGRSRGGVPGVPRGWYSRGVPSEREYVRAWSASSGLPDPTTPGPDGIVRWPFYVALSLFRGAAILAGVRARAAAGNASAPDAAAAGTLVETLANRALLVAGTVPGGVPRGIGSAGTAPRTPPLETTSAVGFEPSPRAAALRSRCVGSCLSTSTPPRRRSRRTRRRRIVGLCARRLSGSRRWPNAPVYGTCGFPRIRASFSSSTSPRDPRARS